MDMDEELKAALNAAADGAWHRMDALGYETPDIAEARQIATAAIVAVHRSMAALMRATGTAYGEWASDGHERMAAAVERIAEES